MDALLKLLAGAGMHIGAGEEAIGEQAWSAARDELDAAEEVLQDLRARWPELSGPEKTIVGKTATPLKARIEAARTQLPKVAAVSEGTPEADAEQDADPDAAP